MVCRSEYVCNSICNFKNELYWSNEGDRGMKSSVVRFFFFKFVKVRMILGWGIWYVVMDSERELGVRDCREGLDILMKDYLRRF